MTKTALENAVMAWLVLGGEVLGDTPVAIFADQDGTRPAPPYLLVKAIVPSVTIGEDEVLVDDSTPPLQYVRGQRYATFSVNAFGEAAYVWLERATLKLHSPAVRAANQTAGIAVQPQGGLNNLSALRDSHTESRWQQDFRVDYERITDADEAEPGVELEVVVHEDTTKSTQTGDRIETVTINL